MVLSVSVEMDICLFVCLLCLWSFVLLVTLTTGTDRDLDSGSMVLSRFCLMRR